MTAGEPPGKHSKLTRDDVLRVAELARLELSAEEVDTFTRQIDGILEHAEQVQAIDTTGVPPTSHPLAAGEAWRADEPAPCLTREQSLLNAPSANVEAGLFKVPKVL